MNQFEPKHDKALLDAQPLFASTWVALFTELRRNYTERQVIAPVDTDSLRAGKEKQSGRKLHSD